MGNIFASDVYMLLPFQRNLITVSMKGSILKWLLETTIDLNTGTNLSPAFFDISGLKMTVDLSRKSGDRITALQVKNSDGSYIALNPNDEYTVVTTDYLADRYITYLTNGISWMGPLADVVRDGIKSYVKYKSVGVKDVDAATDYLRMQKNIRNVAEERTVILQAGVK